MSRRHFVQLFATTAAGAALAACAPKAKPTEQPAAPTEPTPVVEAPTPVPAGGGPKVTIFVGFGTGTDPTQIEGHTQLAKEFNESGQGLTCEFMTVPYDERNTKFSTMLAGDITPDMCMPIGVGGMAAFWDEWLDIAPFIEKDKYDMTDFVGATVKIHTYPGRLLGLPIGVYPQVIYYNEDLFDAAKVEYPPQKWATPDWTYDKLVEIGKKLTLDGAGKNAAESGFDWKTTTQWAWDGWSWMGSPRDVAPKFGGSPLGTSDDYKTAQFNTQGYLDATQWNVDSIVKHHIRANSEQTQAFSQAGDPFGSGKVAMWECWSWMSFAYKGWSDAFNWNIGAVPMVASVGAPKTDEDADTFVLTKHGKQQENAWKVAVWFSSKEILPRLGDIWGCLPARQSALSAWKTKKTENFGEKSWDMFLESINYMFLPNSECWLPDVEKVNDTLNNAWETLTTGKSTDVKAEMDRANTEIQGFLDDYWKTHQS